jgi:hypothetical protein
LVTAAEVRAVARSLPRTSEHLIHDHIKFRVGKIVYVSISPDETTMGVGFPKEERAALIAAEPDKFALPRLSDQRFHWVHARMAALTPQEMRELVTDAWRMVVPKKVAAANETLLHRTRRSYTERGERRPGDSRPLRSVQ